MTDLLAIVAHPDDDAIFCGGTLAKHGSRGDDVHVTYMTHGELGGTGDTTRTELADRRESEARDAGEELGVSVSFLDFEDGRIPTGPRNREPLVGLIRSHAPHLILTHHSEDPHPDHRATHQLVTDAYYEASLPLSEADGEPSDPDNIYYFGKPSAGFEPDVFVNISDVMDTKEQAIRCHQSQLEFLEDHGGIDRSMSDLVEGIRAENRTWGRRCGAKYAEGFTRLHDVANDYLK